MKSSADITYSIFMSNSNIIFIMASLIRPFNSIGSNYTDFDTDLEAEANINEEGNEDCSAIL